MEPVDRKVDEEVLTETRDCRICGKPFERCFRKSNEPAPLDSVCWDCCIGMYQ